MSPAAKPTAKSAAKKTNVWSAAEKAAMKEGARERKSSGKVTPEQERAQGESDIQEKIAGMPEPDKSLALRMHALVLKTAPDLMPRTYYGMPAYARDGKTICFFKPASKFKERYSTFGFEQNARLDDGTMWPTSYAITKLSADDEKKIAAMVKKAVG
ncbi:MAG: DUF1801 domain-containing protein [Candidatus Limnocylindrales bacterium]